MKLHTFPGVVQRARFLVSRGRSVLLLHWLGIVAAALAVAPVCLVHDALAQSADELENTLALRIERRGGCDQCPSYVLGYFPDGPSYFRGIEGTRAMTVRGSFFRRLRQWPAATPFACFST